MNTLVESIKARRTLVLRVVAVLAAVAVLVFILLYANAVGQINALQRGFKEGFELNGSYTRPWSDIHEGVLEGSLYQMAFLADQRGEYEGEWQLRVSDRDNANGLYDATDDPNYYLLTEDGEEVGWVHIAYTDRTGAGIIYAGYKGETYYLEKFDRIPGFVVPSLDDE